MKIIVKDIDTGAELEYRLSRANWLRQWACMKGDRVHMWLPDGIPASPGSWKTSGRIWTIREK